MNTLGDTDEGSPRPSVWPVHLAIGAVVFIGSLCSLFALTSLVHVISNGKYGWWVSPAWTAFYAGYGLLAAVAAGLTMLRPWGYWCAGAWAVIGIVTVGVLWLDWHPIMVIIDLVFVLLGIALLWDVWQDAEE